MRKSEVERVARRMYAENSRFGTMTPHATIRRFFDEMPDDEKRTLLAAARFHLRELRRARGRTVGYVEQVKGRASVTDGVDDVVMIATQREFEPEALVCRVVLLPRAAGRER